MITIFDRMRRGRRPYRGSDRTGTSSSSTLQIPLGEDSLPLVNQRISIARGEHVPVPSRVEDIVGNSLIIAEPALALGAGDQVVVTWEQDGAWCTFHTRVTDVNTDSPVPTVNLSRAGRLSKHDERRGEERHSVEFAVDLRVVNSRAIRPGRELQVHTTEVAGTAVRFMSSAPFAPGDVVEAKISLGTGVTDTIGARLRIIRVDSVAGSWRATVSATFEEVLRSDRARMLATAASMSGGTPEGEVGTQLLTPPPTQDGVGGRDEPQELNTLDAAVEWLKRRDN